MRRHNSGFVGLFLMNSDFEPEGDSFLNFGLTNEERVDKYKRNIKETCRPNCFKPWSEHDQNSKITNFYLKC